MRILRLWLIDVGAKANVLAYWKVMALLGLLLLCKSPSTQAQNACINPLFPGNFSLTKDKVCVGTPVEVKTGPNIINVGYNFQYDGKSPLGQVTFASSTTATYAQPGSYTIIQYGSGGGGTVLCKEVTVLPVDQVKFAAKSCSGRRAMIVPDASTLGQYDQYEVYWGDGVRELKTRAQMALELSHTYTNAGTYTLTVQGIYNAPASCRSTLTTAPPITVAANAAQPTITALKTTSDNSIDITYMAGAGSSVQLFQKINGTYAATGQTGTGGGSFTVQTDAKQVQCFQVQTQDACNSTPLKSDEVCSLVIDVKAANKQNNLSWQPYAGTISGATQFRSYRIYKGSLPAGVVTNQATSSYSDNSNIACGVQYCYSIEATIAGTAQTIVTSAPVCVLGINGELPGDLGSTVVSIENNHPHLVVSLPTTGASSSYTLVVSRASEGSNTYTPVGTIANKNAFTDETADASTGSYCYQITYLTNCGVASAPSAPVCSVYLTSKSPTGIDWTAESPFTPEKIGNYIIEVIDSVNNTRREITNIGVNTHYDLSATDLDIQSQKYRIIAVSDNGAVSYSNFYTFRREAKIWVPDAFTPNNDTQNDTFVIRGTYFDQFRMSIFDRWGEVIYSTTDKTQGWDGKVKGQDAATGQYMYHIEVIDLTGVKTVRTGAVLLVR
ncbi:T9SS type B sorting domain-containing protein [Spirosoma foliorum]|uniref:Gliding motility-associated C-terminal domain-containing protein n=1 Tax=Spirosoma foliorum TaxID=2710596 RepID=A0A7G5GP63_9BACT|nr:gliding motility-associated C-terminal domain-containing protein [Spirosoma foliorum]QMW00655.1 gliding motility-associated C-terminal domain-containing protein [Spirosoma foliorum]